MFNKQSKFAFLENETLAVALPLSLYSLFSENTDSVVFMMMPPSGKHSPTHSFSDSMYIRTFHWLHLLAG